MVSTFIGEKVEWSAAVEMQVSISRFVDAKFISTEFSIDVTSIHQLQGLKEGKLVTN